MCCRSILHCERLRVESPADEQLPIYPELCLNAPSLVSPKLAPKMCMIRLADELEQHFAGVRLSRRQEFMVRSIEIIVGHCRAFEKRRSRCRSNVSRDG